MPIETGPRRYIILPDYGFEGRALASGKLAMTAGTVSVERQPGESVDVRILHGLREDAPKLVEMTAQGELALRREYGTKIQIVPLMHYQVPQPFGSIRADRRLGEMARTVDSASTTTIQVRDRDDGRPLIGARVVAFTLFRHREGVEGYTDADGRLTIDLGPDSRVERLYVFPPDGYWGHFRQSLTAGEARDIRLAPIRHDDPGHAIPRFYGTLPREAGTGVTVGVVDTGVGPHGDLPLDGGRNCVFDEIADDPPAVDDYGDVHRHGTHVAGIVGGRGPIRGVAPGVTLRSYRVFPKDVEAGATNYNIMTAIDQAVSDGCDIVNLSLGQTGDDRVLRRTIERAARAGVLVVAAAGNDNRNTLRYPANYEQSLAVTAIGLNGSFPADSLEEADRARPVATAKPSIFLSRFTNIGPLVDATAPGVGICSTVPGGGIAVMSGTSMAAPAVAGYAAHILASHPSVVGRERDEERRNDLVRLLASEAIPLGLGRQNEGFGLLAPRAAYDRL